MEKQNTMLSDIVSSPSDDMKEKHLISPFWLFGFFNNAFLNENIASNTHSSDKQTTI